MASNKIMSETLSSIGIPLEEMASNLKSDASNFLRYDATLDQIGIHLFKYLFVKNRSSIIKELKAFLENAHSKLLTKQSIKNREAKTKDLHFSADQIMKVIDSKAGMLLGKFMRSLTKKEKSELINTELSELDNFSEMGFSIEEFEDPIFGKHLRIKFKDGVVCDSVPVD